jgi:hypothetical protein
MPARAPLCLRQETKLLVRTHALRAHAGSASKIDGTKVVGHSAVKP